MSVLIAVIGLFTVHIRSAILDMGENPVDIEQD